LRERKPGVPFAQGVPAAIAFSHTTAIVFTRITTNFHRGSSKRLAPLSHTKGKRAKADRGLRQCGRSSASIALSSTICAATTRFVSVEWVQALELYVPVQCFEALIRRRKGERVIRLDWHPLIKMAEPLLCEAGLGHDRIRIICDEKLHPDRTRGPGTMLVLR
jgi:hypothetical protein